MDETSKFSIVKKGYNPSEVDSYINTLDMVLKSYKEKDLSIKNAILNSQIAADNIVRNAEISAEQTVKNAERQANEMRAEAVRQLDAIRESVIRQKLFLNDFNRDYNTLVDKYLVNNNNNNQEISNIAARIDELDMYLQGLSKTEQPPEQN
jgi:cell division septum initiation protein DivIVA